MKRKRFEEELERDFREHIERETDENIERGMAPEDAREAAHRKFGNIARMKEETRRVWTWRWADELSQDLRYALRTLRKNPAFAGVAVLSLALGIGANTAIFSLIDSLLLRRLPVPHPEQLVTLALWGGGRKGQTSLPDPIFDEERARNKVFSQTFAWDGHDFQTTIDGETVQVPGALASGDYFTGLGVPAAIGRTFTPVDDQSNGGPDGPVAVISDAFWARQFQRNQSAVGRAITLDKVRFTIIGVMPRSFFGAEPGSAPEIWAPLKVGNLIGEGGCLNSRSCWFLISMGRLKPGVTQSMAAAQLRVISPEVMKATVPDWGGENRKRFLNMELRPEAGATGFSILRLRFSNPLEILMTLVGVVLLIACANMANLLIARSAARHRETSVRLAIGAGRWRLIRQLLTESVLISAIGAALGLAFAQWSVRLLVGFLQLRRTPISLNLNPDWRVLLFTAGAAILTGLLFGLFPALQATRLGISIGLKQRAQNVVGAPDRLGVGRMLLGGQVALSVLLVAGSGLFAGSLLNLWTMNPGFNSHNLLLMGIDAGRRPEKGAALAEVYTRLLERVNSFPGVKSASVMLITPTTGTEWDDDVSIPGGPEVPPALRDTMVNLVGPRYFETMQTPLRTGREFTRQDTATTEKVGVISEKAARAWFGAKSPIGAHIQFENMVIRIIGVAADAKYLSLREPDPLALYLSYLQNESPGSLSFIARADTGFSSIFPAFHAAVKQIAPGTPISEAKTMDDQVKESLGRERLMASLSIFFGVLALLLTCIGLYGILAYSVARRQGEIGLRVAIGASRSSVIWLILRDTSWHVVAGAGVGVVAVLTTSRFVESFLYGVKPNDVGTLILAVTALAAVAFGAAWIPARRAARLDPMVALRDE